MSPRVAGLLEKIADYPNIPRKKAKFEVSLDNIIPKCDTDDCLFFFCRILYATVSMFEIKGLSLNYGMPSVEPQRRSEIL